MGQATPRAQGLTQAGGHTHPDEPSVMILRACYHVFSEGRRMWKKQKMHIYTCYYSWDYTSMAWLNIWSGNPWGWREMHTQGVSLPQVDLIWFYWLIWTRIADGLDNRPDLWSGEYVCMTCRRSPRERDVDRLHITEYQKVDMWQNYKRNIYY